MGAVRSCGRTGLGSQDADRRRVGYAARTAPRADVLRGYSGPTDTLMVFDASDRLTIWNRRFRTLLDLPEHVGQVGFPLLDMIAMLATERGAVPPDEGSREQPQVRQKGWNQA